MSKLWEELSRILCCPDDREQLSFCGSEYLCQACAQRFPILLGRIADLRPRNPQPNQGDANLQFSRDYVDEFRRTCESTSDARAWGAPEDMPRRWVRKRQRQVRFVQECEPGALGGRMAGFLMPPTRHLFLFEETV
jgi:hypothetical protein